MYNISMDLPYFNTLYEHIPKHPRAVVCGWKDKATVTRTEDYSLLGNLYSNYGVEVMLSNISKLEYISQLVVLEHNQYLEDLYNGIAQPKHLPKNSLKDIKNWLEITTKFTIPKPPLYKRCFSVIDDTYHADFFPSENQGYIIRANSIEDAWEQLVCLVNRFGILTIKWKELLNTIVVIENTNIEIPIDYAAYIYSFLHGIKIEESSYTYNKRMCKHFFIDQITKIKEILSSKLDVRTVISLWDPHIDLFKDHPPCLITINFRLRDNRLYITANFRSHDVYRAWKYNVYALYSLGKKIVEDTAIIFKSLCIISNSAHIYKESLGESEKIKSGYRFIQDKRGNFLVEKDKTIKHFDFNGNLIQVFRPKNIVEARRMLAPFISRPDHALYIGEVLARVFLMGEDSRIEV